MVTVLLGVRKTFYANIRNETIAYDHFFPRSMFLKMTQMALTLRNLKSLRSLHMKHTTLEHSTMISQ